MKKLFAILAVAGFVFAACGQKKADAPATDTAVDQIIVEEEVVETPIDTTAVIAVEEVPAQ